MTPLRWTIGDVQARSSNHMLDREVSPFVYTHVRHVLHVHLETAVSWVLADLIKQGLYLDGSLLEPDVVNPNSVLVSFVLR